MYSAMSGALLLSQILRVCQVTYPDKIDCAFITENNFVFENIISKSWKEVTANVLITSLSMVDIWCNSAYNL
jgi:hypothetical protein